MPPHYFLAVGVAGAGKRYDPMPYFITFSPCPRLSLVEFAPLVFGRRGPLRLMISLEFGNYRSGISRLNI